MIVCAFPPIPTPKGTEILFFTRIASPAAGA